MSPFVGRDTELAALEDAYATGTFQFAVNYGRRRVGKTSLIHAFSDDKTRVCFFTAQETTIGENAVLLSEAIATLDASPLPLAPAPTSASIRAALESMFLKAQTEQIIFVIDEYPYLAKCDSGVSSWLQTLIDRYQSASKLFLILCGSSMSFMEHQVLGYKSPLYGRRTMQLRVKPFTVFEAQKMLPGASAQSIVELYAAVGGIPLYLSQLDPTQSTADNIAHAILRPGAYLQIEPENYLLQEVRNPAIYNAVISAIASGYVRPKEISDVTAIPAPQVSQLLDALLELQIVEKVTPLVHGKKRQVVYRICDNLFRFWYRFMPRNAALIEAGLSDRVAQSIVDTDLSTFVGPVFEDVCRQWLIQQVVEGTLDFLFRGIGTWWGTNPKTKRSEEIDIVLEEMGGDLIIGECKWRNELVDVDVLDTLKRRGALLENKITRYYLFSKSGFTDSCRAKAKADGNVGLITLEEMFE